MTVCAPPAARRLACLAARSLAVSPAAAQRVRPAAPSPRAYAGLPVGSDPFEARDLMGDNPAADEELYAPNVVVGPSVLDGMSVGPNTGFDGVCCVRGAGYRHSDGSVQGISHLNGRYGQFGYAQPMPTVGRVQTVPGAPGGSEEGYRSPRDAAWPGYYGVHLDRYAVTAELTATRRTALHRHTFPATDSANVLLDIGNLSLRPPHGRDYWALQRAGSADSLCTHYARTWGKRADAHLAVTDDSTAEGWQRTEADTVYVTARFSRPFRSVSTWTGPAAMSGRAGARCVATRSGTRSTLRRTQARRSSSASASRASAADARDAALTTTLSSPETRSGAERQ